MYFRFGKLVPSEPRNIEQFLSQNGKILKATSIASEIKNTDNNHPPTHTSKSHSGNDSATVSEPGNPKQKKITSPSSLKTLTYFIYLYLD